MIMRPTPSDTLLIKPAQSATSLKDGTPLPSQSDNLTSAASNNSAPSLAVAQSAAGKGAEPAPLKRAPSQVQMSRRDFYIVLSQLMLVMFLSCLDQTVVGVALPSIVVDLQGFDVFSWVLASYLLFSCASQSLYGKFADLVGRKIVLQTALAIFLVGSALAGLSWDMYFLIVARGIQGLGAGGLMALCSIIVADMTTPQERGKYMGILQSVFALASIAGPLLGGFLTDSLSWRYTFYINLPFGIVALVLIQKFMNINVPRFAHKIDFVGSVLVVLATCTLVLFTTWGGDKYAWSSSTILLLIGLSAILFALFFAWEYFYEEPLISLRLLHVWNVALSYVIGFVTSIAFFGIANYLAIYFQYIYRDSATVSGLRTIPMLIMLMLCSTVCAFVSSKTGEYRGWTAVAEILQMVSAFLFWSIDDTTSYGYIILCMVIFGAGIGFFFSPLMLVTQVSVPHKDLANATTSLNFFRSLGGAIGAALFGSVLNSRMNKNLDSDFNGHVPGGLNAEWASKIDHINSTYRATAMHAFGSSFGETFFIAVPILVLPLILACLYKKAVIPPRESKAGNGDVEMGALSA